MQLLRMVRCFRAHAAVMVKFMRLFVISFRPRFCRALSLSLSLSLLSGDGQATGEQPHQGNDEHVLQLAGAVPMYFLTIVANFNSPLL